AGSGRRDLDGRLVRRDLDERIVLPDLLSFLHEPARDLALGQALPQVRQLELVGHGAAFYLNASSRRMACTPLAPLTICVTARSTPTLASASAWLRSTSSSRSIRSSIVAMHCSAARSRSSSKPKATHAPSTRAIGEPSSSSLSSKVSCARSTGHSIAVPDTSPSPCAPCPSPASRSAPSTGIGRESVVPA